MTAKKELERAKIEIGASDCLKGLELRLLENHCTKLQVTRGKHEVTVRCMKVDTQRKNFWDTWWFRITSSTLRVHPAQMDQVERHTICHDGQVRIEAYPPE